MDKIPVDKQGFQDSFSIVEAPAGSCYVDNLFRALGYHTLAISQPGSTAWSILNILI